MRHSLFRPLAAALMLGSLACATSTGSAGDQAAEPAQTVRSPAGTRSDVITLDEIERSSVATAYDAVQRLRPAFLRTRGRGSIRFGAQQAVVYLDDTPIGGPDALRRINARDVMSIRYLRGPDATTRFGTGHEGGAILVTTKR